MSKLMEAQIPPINDLDLSRPDISILTETKEFLKKVFENCEGLVEVRAIKPEELRTQNSVNTIQEFYEPTKLPLIKLVGLNKAGYQVFFGPATRRERSGTKDSVLEVSALFIDVDSKDFDDDKDIALRNIQDVSKKTGLKANYVVDSGNGYHLYFVLEKKIVINSPDDITKIESILKGIAELFGGDNTWDISHVMKLPATYNLKDLSNPKLSTIIESDLSRLYKLKDFERYAKQIKSSVKGSGFKLDKIPDEIPDGFPESLDGDKELKLVWEGKKKLKDNTGSGKDIALAHALKKRAYKAEEAARIIMSAPYKKENERSTNYISRTLSKVFEKEQENGDEKYFVGDDGCLYKNHTTKEGVIPKRLASFNAEIVKEVF